jgi:drug/metabolite transporter (DMT)-like permease
VRRLGILAFIWGWSFLFIKIAVEGLTPTTVAWARIALGAAALHLFLRHQHLRLPRDRTTRRHFAVVAVFGNMAPFSLLAWAEEDITSALTSVLNASTPLFTAIFAAVALRERLRPVQVFCLLVGISGVTLAAGLGASDLHGSSLTASLAGVAAGAFYGIGFTYMRRHLTDIPPLVAATGQLSAGALLLAPVALVTSVNDGFALTPGRAGAVILLGAVGTGVAFVLNYQLVGQVGATRASLVTYLVPVVAITVGVVVLGEPFEWRLLLGAALTIGGIAGVTYGRGRPEPPPQPPCGTSGVARTGVDEPGEGVPAEPVAPR